ncbi:glycosyltransferase family 2 protein [Alteromonas halophila]|uniref:Glycosyl transferase family A n=1 Tax=Alteromonas halophila TaxID=516698 RepID=A0A918JNA2_9ALTE|nr:glycosyltransferase [Alteromonas halophila]GGW90037.1 glycosyl transferase family A [Alteromonas halophila]
MDNSVSVVTIVKNRTSQLRNLVKQLENSSLTPDELVVVWMAPPSDYSLMTSDKFTITHKFAVSESLPIARARNKGIEAASADIVAYVAVDALISKDALLKGVNSWKPRTVVTSQPRKVSDEDYRKGYAFISSQTRLHNVRSKETHHGMLSHDSGCATLFFIHQKDFTATGGFDQRYTGFGLNDEDFFSQCRELGLGFTRLNDDVFVRANPQARCPLHHLLDFCNNAEQFRRKWGRYPRHQTLTEFAMAGYINRDFEQSGLHIQQLPDTNAKTDEIEQQPSPQSLPARMTTVA